MSSLWLTALAFAAIGFVLPSQSGAVTAKTTRFVAGFEGFLSCVYADPVGHATIGYGHLLHLGPPTRRDRKKWGCISRKRALKLLRKDLRETEIQVMSRIRGARVTGSMITALTSFAFNLGPGVLDRYRQKKTKKVTNIAMNVRKGKYRRAGRQMLIYNAAIVGGRRQVLPGLVTRRRKEYRLMVKDLGNLNRTCARNCGSGSDGGGGSGNGGMTVS